MPRAWDIYVRLVVMDEGGSILNIPINKQLLSIVEFIEEEKLPIG